MRKVIDENITKEELRNVINHFYDNYDEFIKDYIICFLYCYCLCRNDMWESTFSQHYNSASDIPKEMLYFTYD